MTTIEERAARGGVGVIAVWRFIERAAYDLWAGVLVAGVIYSIALAAQQEDLGDLIGISACGGFWGMQLFQHVRRYTP